MKEYSYELPSTGKEFPARFGGRTLTYELPSTLDEYRALVDSSVEDVDAVLVSNLVDTNQGLNLRVQKFIKARLDSKEAPAPAAADATEEQIAEQEATVQAFIDKALADALAAKIGAPRAKGEGSGAKVKKELDTARAALEATRAALQEAYTGLPKNTRKSFRDKLLAQGTFTAEELDAMDQA
jgi:hypothetical protein